MEFIDLKAQYRALKKEIDKSTRDIFASAKFIGGPQVEQLEERLAKYIGRKYCITCASGTDALLLSYMAYGIGPGDAVFCPDMTFIASIEPACLLGAEPVFCDIEEDSYNISPAALERQIKRVEKEGRLSPKAVVAVDFLGNPAKHNEIELICRKHGLIHIEDGAQSTGSLYNGCRCGSLGDIATTSFFPSKPLGCYGDGGAIFTDRDDAAEIIKSLKVHGKGPKGKYDNVRIGTNSRLDTVQAGVLLAKLDALPEEMQKRQEIAKRYDEAFEGKLQIPKIADCSISSYAQYCMLAESEEERTKILAAMKEADVPSLIYYPNTLHSLKAFVGYDSVRLPAKYTHAERYAKCNFGVPFSPYLTKKDQDRVIKTVLSAL